MLYRTSSGVETMVWVFIFIFCVSSWSVKSRDWIDFCEIIFTFVFLLHQMTTITTQYVPFILRDRPLFLLARMNSIAREWMNGCKCKMNEAFSLSKADYSSESVNYKWRLSQAKSDNVSIWTCDPTKLSKNKNCRLTINQLYAFLCGRGKNFSVSLLF